MSNSERQYVPAEGGGHYFVGHDATISSTAIIEEGCIIGHRTFIGHHCVLRPGTRIGSDSVVGHGSVFEGDCQVGDRVLIHAQCHITAGAVIEDDVFIAPMFVGANDPKMSHGRRHVIPFERNAYTIRRGARIAIGVSVLPGVEIGSNAVIGAGSVVTQSIPAEAIAFGNPARVRGTVDPAELL